MWSTSLKGISSGGLVHYWNHKVLLAIAQMVLLETLAAPLARAQAQAMGQQSALGFDAEQRGLDFRSEQPGVRAGSFRLLPSAAVSMAYDSNIFAAPAPREEAALSIAEAKLHLQNEPGVLALEGEAFVRGRRFMEAHDQDTTEYGASVAAESQPNAQSEFSGRMLAQRRFESRNEIETPNFRAVSYYQEWRGDLGYWRAFNRFALRATLSGRRLDYEEPSQAFRDRSSYRAELRGTYDLRNAVSMIGTGYYSEEDYRILSPLAASAQTAGTLAGARLSLPDVADLELMGGYFHRTFAQQRGEISGLSVRGSLTLRPTRLTTVRADVVREDAATRVVGAFGKIRTDGSLEIRHAYSRTLDLHASSRFIVDEFAAARRTDRTLLAQVGATWLLSSRYVIAAAYEYAGRDSAATGESFVRHLTSVSLLGRF